MSCLVANEYCLIKLVTFLQFDVASDREICNLCHQEPDLGVHSASVIGVLITSSLLSYQQIFNESGPQPVKKMYIDFAGNILKGRNILSSSLFSFPLIAGMKSGAKATILNYLGNQRQKTTKSTRNNPV